MSLPESAAVKAGRRSTPSDSAAKRRNSAKSLKQAAGVAAPRQAKTPDAIAKKTPLKGEPVQSRVLEATNLAKELEAGLAEGRLDVLTPQALQALMAALCKTYAANIEAGHNFSIIGNRSAVTSTDVMVSCAALLKAADLQVFELGMWQSWTGR